MLQAGGPVFGAGLFGRTSVSFGQIPSPHCFCVVVAAKICQGDSFCFRRFMGIWVVIDGASVREIGGGEGVPETLN